MHFHSDSAFLDAPLMTLLFGVYIPSCGGNTLFANNYEAYEELPALFAERLEDLMAVNTYDYASHVRTERLDRTKAPLAVDPVIRTHPESGRKAIYVNRLMTEEIVGLPEPESDAMLDELFALVKRRGFCYEHVWQKGDLLMWNNRCVQHA